MKCLYLLTFPTTTTALFIFLQWAILKKEKNVLFNKILSEGEETRLGRQNHEIVEEEEKKLKQLDSRFFYYYHYNDDCITASFANLVYTKNVFICAMCYYIRIEVDTKPHLNGQLRS